MSHDTVAHLTDLYVADEISLLELEDRLPAAIQWDESRARLPAASRTTDSIPHSVSPSATLAREIRRVLGRGPLPGEPNVPWSEVDEFLDMDMNGDVTGIPGGVGPG